MQDGLTDKSNVVPLQRFAALTEVEAYWEALRGERNVPLRSEVDPRGIQRALAHSFILERAAPGIARFRIAGSVFNNLMGMEVRGMPITSVISLESRDEFREILEEVFAAPATARLNLAGEMGTGHNTLDAQMLLLPLRSDFGEVSRILGCVAWTGESKRAPRRLTLRNSVVRHLPAQAEQAAPISNSAKRVARQFHPAPLVRDGELKERPLLVAETKAREKTIQNTMVGTRQIATRAPYLRLVVTDG